MVCGHHAVLKEHRLSLERAVFEPSFPSSERYTMQFKDVSIISDNMMNFHWIASMDNDFWL
jgi:hypothetical protein